MLDPKMDSGYVAPGESTEPDYDVTMQLSAEQVLGVMDELLCHEV